MLQRLSAYTTASFRDPLFEAGLLYDDRAEMERAGRRDLAVLGRGGEVRAATPR